MTKIKCLTPPEIKELVSSNLINIDSEIEFSGGEIDHVTLEQIFKYARLNDIFGDGLDLLGNNHRHRESISYAIMPDGSSIIFPEDRFQDYGIEIIDPEIRNSSLNGLLANIQAYDVEGNRYLQLSLTNLRLKEPKTVEI